MKIHQIVHSLESEDWEAVDFVISQNPSRPFGELINCLKNSADPPEKSDLFVAAFGKPWTKKQDYLLRNELRLLTEAVLRGVLISRLSQEKIHHASLLSLEELRFYVDSGNIDLFEKGLRKYRKKAKVEDNSAFLEMLADLEVKVRTEKKEIMPDAYREILGSALNHRELVLKNSIRKIRNSEVAISFAERVLSITEEIQPKPFLSTFSLEETDDPIAAFFAKKAQSYRVSGLEKIGLLKEADLLLNGWEGDSEYISVQKQFLNANIALEYFLLGEYETADQYYENWLQEVGKANLRLEILFNYCSNLIRLKKYARVLEIVEEWWKKIKSEGKVYYRFLCLVGMCHLFLGNDTEAIKSIPSDIQQRPQPQYFYFRLILIIAYTVREDVDAAERECQNLLKTINYQEKILFDIRPVLKFFLSYFRLIQEKESDRNNLMSDLGISIQKFVKKSPPMIADYLPLTWLREQIKNHG